MGLYDVRVIVQYHRLGLLVASEVPASEFWQSVATSQTTVSAVHQVVLILLAGAWEPFFHR